MTRNRDIAKILGLTEANNTSNNSLLNTASPVGLDSSQVSSIVAASGLTVYATLDDLPSSGLTSGDQAFVSSTSRFYISNGSGWYNVALINATPSLTIDPTGTIILATDGVTPTVITLTATDSDNPIAALTYSVESDGNFGGLATISQDSSVFTITPLSQDSATTESSTLTFKASDGISFGSGTTQFSLTFGPDYTIATKLTIVPNDASTTGQANFGQSCSISGDGNYAVVGATFDRGTYNGSSYFFSKSGSTWTQMLKTWPGNDAGYGNATAMNSDGTYAAVSAWYDDANGTNSGAVFVYNRSGSTWSQQQKLISPDTDNLPDNFGFDVDMNPNATYMIVGAPNSSTGEAFIFTRSGSTWTVQQKLTASDGASSDSFGNNVSISSDGTYAIVGSPRSDPNGSASGSAYIFVRSGSTWTQQAKITASDAKANDAFSSYGEGGGVSINSDGTYVAVGKTEEFGTATGAVHIFTRSGSTWTEQAKLTASDAASGDRLGWRVMLNDDATVLAAMAYTAGSPWGTNAGAVYIFTRSGSTWTEQEILFARQGGTTGRTRGMGMTSDGSSLLVGSIYDNISGYSNVGAAFEFVSG